MPPAPCHRTPFMSTGDFVLILETPAARRVDGLSELEGLPGGVVGRVVDDQDGDRLRQAQGGSLVLARQAGRYAIHCRPPLPSGCLLNIGECPLPNAGLAQK